MDTAKPLLLMHQSQLVVREKDLEGGFGGLVYVREAEEVEEPGVVLCTTSDACHADAAFPPPRTECNATLSDCQDNSWHAFLTTKSFIDAVQPVSSLSQLGNGSVSEIAVGLPPKPLGGDFEFTRAAGDSFQDA